jgi:hypothetical protein
MKKPQDPTREQIDDVIKNHFGLNPVNEVVNFETVRRDTNPAAFDRMREEFEKSLAARPDREDILRRSFFGPTFAIHLQSVFPRSEVKWIRPDMTVHFPVCTAEEIMRIQNPQTVADDLLALRANAIADSARLKRVFLRRRSLREHDWSLTSSFRDTAFQQYLAALPQEKRAKCRRVPAGFAFLKEPNGACMRSERGDFIVISEALEHYLYYMNAFLFEPEELSTDDLVASLMIAVRSMFLKESLDFDLDPRGDLPPALDQRLRAVVEDQIQFVIGHEYGHVLLKHLDRHAASAAPRGVIPGYVQSKLQYYTPLQNQELAADAASLLDPVVDDQILTDRLMGAIWFFLGLELLYGAAQFVKNSPLVSKTHPPPIERLWALNETVLVARPSIAAGAYSHAELDQMVARTLRLKGTLLEDFFPNNRHQFEVYGAIHLPTFRGPPLADRIDY